MTLTLPGWTCPSCGCFNGSAKEVLAVCRACGTKRPGSEDVLTKDQIRFFIRNDDIQVLRRVFDRLVESPKIACNHPNETADPPGPGISGQRDYFCPDCWASTGMVGWCPAKGLSAFGKPYPAVKTEAMLEIGLTHPEYQKLNGLVRIGEAHQKYFEEANAVWGK